MNMTKSLLFFKKHKNVNKELNFNDFSTIIPVNFESAEYLDMLKIQYALPESYVTLEDYNEIDLVVINLSKTLWNLKKQISDFFIDPSIRKNMLKNSEKFLNDYLLNQGTSCQYIASLFTKCIK